MSRPVYSDKMKDVRENIYNRLLYRHNPGAMRPRLYNTLEEHGKSVNGLKLQWMYYAGMGDVALHDHLQEQEKKAALSLVKDGLLVPTLEENFYDVAKIQQLTPFDDVQWALDSEKSFVIFELSHNEHFPDIPDTVIRPDERHDAAIAELKYRAQFSTSIGKTWVSTPITLKDGTEIHPILTNPKEIELQMRRQGEGLIPKQP